jgi:hypothetical protein
MIRTSLCLFALCVSALISSAQEADPHRLDWLTGCWQGDDGVTREVWSGSQDGYYFGYSVVTKNDHVIFFEQMRIDPAPLPVFNAYPAGEGPFAFVATELSETSITFADPEHDFPQKIKYWRSGEFLRATISLIDGSSAGEFSFTRCPAD